MNVRKYISFLNDFLNIKNTALAIRNKFTDIKLIEILRIKRKSEM